MTKQSKSLSGNKRILTAVAAVAGIGLVAILTYRLLADGSAHPAVLLVLAALISLALPAVRANLFPSAKDCAAEYDFHEQRLAEQNRGIIADSLGQDTCDQIQTPPANGCDSAEAQIRQLLEQDSVRRDTDLRFALLVTFARHCEKGGDARKSIQYLTEALESQPYHFIANFRLAMNHEWNNSREQALHHYRQALLDPGGISRGMRKLTVSQINRLQMDSG